MAGSAPTEMVTLRRATPWEAGHRQGMQGRDRIHVPATVVPQGTPWGAVTAVGYGFTDLRIYPPPSPSSPAPRSRASKNQVTAGMSVTRSASRVPRNALSARMILPPPWRTGARSPDRREQNPGDREQRGAPAWSWSYLDSPRRQTCASLAPSVGSRAPHPSCILWAQGARDPTRPTHGPVGPPPTPVLRVSIP
jgi:hypothetical protein